MPRPCLDLGSLICRFEGPISDQEFLSLAEITAEAADIAAHARCRLTWTYLIARFYELLGYCARHTPWLLSHPKHYWYNAYCCYHDAAALASQRLDVKDDTRSFLRGKDCLREALSTSPTDQAAPHLIEQAQLFFELAARQAPTQELRRVYLYEAEVTERILREQRQRDNIRRVCANPSSTVEGINEELDRVFSEMSPPQPEVDERRAQFLSARLLESKARMHHTVLSELSRRHARPETSEVSRPLLAAAVDDHLHTMRDLLSQVAKAWDALGLHVRAAHCEAQQSRVMADTLFDRCVAQFRIAVHDDEKRLAQELRATADLPERIPQISAAQLTEGPLLPFARDQIRRARIDLVESATLIRLDKHRWRVSSGYRHYLIEEANNEFWIRPLAPQGMPFDPAEGLRLHAYSDLVHDACRHYSGALKSMRAASSKRAAVYKSLMEALASSKATQEDIESLREEIKGVLHELNDKHHPDHALIRRRVQYCWSLLEMFRVRCGVAHVQALTSGELIFELEDPFADPQSPEGRLHIGSDPLLRSAVGMLFCGAKGEEDMHGLHIRVLKTVLKTMFVLRRNLELMRNRPLLRQLECHENLVLGIRTFTVLLFTGAPNQITLEGAKEHAEKVEKHLEKSRQALQDIATIGSHLVDENALEAITSYIRGVTEAVFGMVAHLHGRHDWQKHYDAGIEALEQCLRVLPTCDRAYLMGDERERRTYQGYVLARLRTLKAWRARNRFETSRLRADADEAAGHFGDAKKTLADLGDYRGVTKAKARELEMRVMGALGVGDEIADHAHSIRLLSVWFAACRDADGLKRVRLLEVQMRDAVGMHALSALRRQDYRHLKTLNREDLLRMIHQALDRFPLALRLGFRCDRLLKSKVPGLAAEVRLLRYYCEERRDRIAAVVEAIRKGQVPDCQDVLDLTSIRPIGRWTEIDRSTVQRSEVFKIFEAWLQAPPQDLPGVGQQQGSRP